MSFRLAATITLVGSFLASCAPLGQVGDHATIWGQSVSGGYSYGTYKYYVSRSPALVEVVGKAGDLGSEATSQAILDGFLASNQMYDLNAVTDKEQDHSDAVRVVFLLNPRKALLANTVCETEKLSSLQSEKTDPLRQEVVAVYCLHNRANSSLRANYGVFSELTESKVTTLTRNLTYDLLPPNHPERGRNCSDLVTTDC